MNAQDPFEQFLLLPGEVKATLKTDFKVPNTCSYEILKEDDTLGAILQSQLLKNKDVIFAAYRKPHPFEHKIIIRIQTNGKISPNEALNRAMDELIYQCSALSEQLNIFEKQLQFQKDNVTNDGMYHGLSAYKTYLEKKDTTLGNASSVAVRQGPVRASQNIRVTTRWDYNPEVCKDYKETGFCGFGDSCVFIHDRSDYKSGWEIDLEYEQNKQPLDYSKFEIHDHDHDHDHHHKEEVSLTCPICGNYFVNPVKTKCNHYFCEKCALDNFKKSARCFTCDTQNFGIFNPAIDLLKKIENFEEKLKARQESEDNDFDSDDLKDIGEVSKEIVNECHNINDIKTDSNNDSTTDDSEN